MKKRNHAKQTLCSQITHEYEELTEQVQKLLRHKGTETFKKVKKIILEERYECREIREALRHFLSYRQTGFLVRPTLISLGCEAVGGNTETVARIATPLVLMSGGMDIHDDIMDETKKQDSSPTIFGKYGKDISLLCGDALLFKGLILWHSLIEVLTIEKFIKINNILKEAFFELGDGQALELSQKSRFHVDPKQYLHIIEKKAADIEALLKIGALIGDGSPKEISALGEYGRCLGMLWILADDIADIFDHKEIRKRISNRFLPLPMIFTLIDLKNETELQTHLEKKKITNKDTEKIIQVVKKTAGIARTKKVMQDLASEALKRINKMENNEALELLIKHTSALVDCIESMH